MPYISGLEGRFDEAFYDTLSDEHYCGHVSECRFREFALGDRGFYGFAVSGHFMGEKWMKVYCQNCQHYKSGYSNRHYEFCAVAKAQPGTFDTYRSPMPYSTPTPQEKNVHNDCTDFKVKEDSPHDGEHPGFPC